MNLSALIGPLGLAAVTLFGASCGPHAVDPVPTPKPADLAASTMSFLERVPRAPEIVAHHGTRRLTFEYTVAGQLEHLAYTERVTADGQGRFAIDPVSVEQPLLAPAQLELFEELQRRHAGFFFKYRDVRIRDLALFLENYSAEQLSSPVTVAGIDCVELSVRHLGSSPTSYRLAIDAETGLVLRTIEIDSSEHEIARSEFVEFELGLPSEAVDYFEERYPGTPLDATGSNAGFPIAQPQVVPAGFRELTSDFVDIAGSRIVRRFFGDGLENFFFLERHALPGSATPAPSFASSGALTPSVVRATTLGPWTIAELDEVGTSRFVLGRISEADVLQVLQSSL